MPNFPHLNETAFPHIDNVDVYKYQNVFDYERYDNAQMHLTICNVPWDMGEAHIGNRTISGIGNVVWFETEEKRDKWFSDIPDDKCVRITTKYKELHRDNQIMLPIPFDVACTFNYLMVEYEPFTSTGELVQYETNNGLRKWFWFIREVEFVAPNATRVHLLNDSFQTFMYRLNISGMILERGHAPLFDMDAETYLSNPLANNTGLLAEDVDFGREPSHVTHTGYHVFNENNYAVIACTSSPTSSWGAKAENDWHTPALANYTVDGVPSYRMFAIDVSALNTFLSNVESDFPQFKQTVKGVFFAPRELLTLGSAFNFAETACHWVSTSKQTLDLLELDKSQFHYPARYDNLAKLYTSPYAHIEVTDENGQTEVVRIEDTTGELRIGAALSLAFPAISIQAHLFGYGGANNTAISFANITERSLTIGGKWYDTLHTWDIPVFGIIQSSAKQNDYNTHFDRLQQQVAYNNAYTSATASANTAKANADASALTDQQNSYASAATQKTNADNSADTITDNATLQTTANTSSTAAGALESTLASFTNATLNVKLTGNANAYTNASTNASIAQQEAQAAASQAANGVGTALSAGMSIASGNVVGGVMAIANGVTSAATMAVQTEAGINYSLAQAAASNANNSANAIDTNDAQADLNQQALNAANSRRDAANALTSGAAANNSATMKGNASNTKTMMEANADRTYNTATANNARTQTTDTANAARARDTAQNAVTNQIKQAALGKPFEFGEMANTGQATTKPMAMFANIVTQTKSAIAQAGDEFLRYGYYYNKQWDFDGNWNIGKHFTYWKLADFWVKGLSIPDMYVDKLRFFLFGGVTVWRKPEDIGNVSIYENM